jgi:hypothetical protein
MDEPRVALDLSETELELIMLFMKVGLVIHDTVDIDLGIDDEIEKAKYVEQAENLYERLTDVAKFEFLVRRLDDEPDI